MHSEINLITTFTLLWNIWKASNDLLFKKKTWSRMQVIHATKAMLNAGSMEDCEEDYRPPTLKPSNPSSNANSSILPAGFKAYVNVTFNPSVLVNEAFLGSGVFELEIK